MKTLVNAVACLTFFFIFAFNSYANDEENLFLVHIEANNKFERSEIADLGLAIDGIQGNVVEAIATRRELALLHKTSFKFRFQDLKFQPLDFPSKDSRYHNYEETTLFLKGLAEEYPELTELKSIGKSIDGRDIWMLHIRANADAENPGIAFMGNHHGREHLSVEVPLFLAHYLLAESNTPRIKELLQTRDIWIIPMVNPDGAEFDIKTGTYKWWRKNRRKNENSTTYGVDLNRNYGFQWGKNGSSSSPWSQTYRGTEAFSEPETQAIRDFVLARKNIKVLISYHTFSELILYPWGHTHTPISNPQDLRIFEDMAKDMGKMTGYKPQSSSDLYLVSGDTTDWAYGELGIYAFTFELSPKSISGGGFYPGDIIDRVVDVNIETALYAIEKAGFPGLSIF